MYETLMMLKPGTLFPPERMEEVVRDVCHSMPRGVNREKGTITVRGVESALLIHFNDAPWVVEESAEIATEYGLDCADCAARYEMNGEEEGEGLELFNDALLISERLEELGFILLAPWREETL